uniref:prostaglandin G/H synthase 2-like n=1 Tax=Ciona intestinalis TaxID=7719 RepID=UPI000180BECA|nr:prostaglandin G/H synthase 2-like [Ciona intestinalis]|eukprot:XP_002123273.1 prostaglandin G/H synthase 2-like [Ciona intestinalis]
MKSVLLQTAVLLVGCILDKCESYDPCCAFPCKHSAICTTLKDDYECDCTGTGFYGRNCEYGYFSTYVTDLFRPSRSTLHHYMTNYSLLWKLVNNISWLQKKLMAVVLKIRTNYVYEPSPYVGMDSYPTWDSYINKTVYARTLPPIPQDCPTPMGTKGPKTLPDIKVLRSLLFQRNKFEPCPMRTNVFFAFFAQHFTHQFFKTNTIKGMPFQWGEHSVDLSHVYGHTIQRQHELRSHIDGKLKVFETNGEVFPPLTESANVTMSGEKLMRGRKFAIGHPGFGAFPSFFVIATLWLREHNRVCDILKDLHPDWDDERLFQTARLILTGETLKIIVEDYVQHVSGFHFQLSYDPEILHKSTFSYNNQIHAEFHILYHWHMLMPDFIELGEHVYPLKELLFNVDPVVEIGMETVLKQLSNQFAGKVVGGRNQGPELVAVVELALKQTRQMRMCSFNKYRERFGMKPYTSFEELTGETEVAALLRNLYYDIDALELFVGYFVEHRRNRQVLGATMLEMGAPYSLKGVFGNPIGSPAWWKPSTFGGEVGFNIIKTTNLKNFICRNVKGCPDISFKVPQDVPYNSVEGKSSSPNTGIADVLISLTRPQVAQKSQVKELKREEKTNEKSEL